MAGQPTIEEIYVTYIRINLDQYRRDASRTNFQRANVAEAMDAVDGYRAPGAYGTACADIARAINPYAEAMFDEEDKQNYQQAFRRLVDKNKVLQSRYTSCLIDEAVREMFIHHAAGTTDRRYIISWQRIVGVFLLSYKLILYCIQNKAIDIVEGILENTLGALEANRVSMWIKNSRGWGEILPVPDQERIGTLEGRCGSHSRHGRIPRQKPLSPVSSPDKTPKRPCSTTRTDPAYYEMAGTIISLVEQAILSQCLGDPKFIDHLREIPVELQLSDWEHVRGNAMRILELFEKLYWDRTSEVLITGYIDEAMSELIGMDDEEMRKMNLFWKFREIDAKKVTWSGVVLMLTIVLETANLMIRLDNAKGLAKLVEWTIEYFGTEGIYEFVNKRGWETVSDPCMLAHLIPSVPTEQSKAIAFDWVAERFHKAPTPPSPKTRTEAKRLAHIPHCSLSKSSKSQPAAKKLKQLHLN